MSAYSHVPAGHHSNDHLDTSYRGSSNHRRSQSEAAQDRIALSDEMALLDREKHAVDDLYDPHTRSGRPSFARSTPSSPMLNPAITVSSPQPLPLNLAGSSRSKSEGSYGRSRGPSGGAKFWARFRFVLVTLTLVASALVLACNAHILAVYNTHKAAGKWVDRAGQDGQSWWSAWPTEGIDLRPLYGYLGVGIYGTVVMLLFFVLSIRKSFRYLESVVSSAAFIILAGVISTALWVLVTAYLQFQAKRWNTKHSFRTWACSHSDNLLYKVDGVNYSLLCTEANAARYTGIAAAGLSLALLLTAIFSCCTGRRSRGYGKVGGAPWMPKWSRK